MTESAADDKQLSWHDAPQEMSQKPCENLSKRRPRPLQVDVENGVLLNINLFGFRFWRLLGRRLGAKLAVSAPWVGLGTTYGRLQPVPRMSGRVANTTLDTRNDPGTNLS